MEERTRIALDLHDGLVQTLIGLNYKLDLLEQMSETSSAGIRSLAGEVRSQLKEVIEEARYVVFNLKPIYFEKTDLIPALRSYLKSYEKQSGIATSLKIVGNEVRIPPRTKVFLFRIVQESLSNVKRHARAKQVRVGIRVKARDLTTIIRDDGIGFSIKEISNDPEKWTSFGVRGIEERARLLGGNASIMSSPGHGTTIQVTLPLETREAVLYNFKLRQQ